jgi:signal transduction histidine kinase
VPPENVLVHGDKEKLMMALSNVLNNAVKYSPENSFIEFDYELHDDEIWIRVKDQGVGIPADKLKIIFHEFYQVEDHMTRRYGGMGLGLAISSAIAEASDGRIWAESPGEDQGTTITLSLPIVK